MKLSYQSLGITSLQKTSSVRSINSIPPIPEAFSISALLPERSAPLNNNAGLMYGKTFYDSHMTQQDVSVKVK